MLNLNFKSQIVKFAFSVVPANEPESRKANKPGFRVRGNIHECSIRSETMKGSLLSEGVSMERRRQPR
jgi:hypothetical protein